MTRTRTCSRCGTSQPLSSYPPTRGERHRWCRPCLAAEAAERRRASGAITCHLRMPPELRAALIRAAAEEGLPLARWAREIILDSVGAMPEERRAMPPRDLAPGPVLRVPLLPRERRAIERVSLPQGMTYGQWAQRALRRAVGWPEHDPEARHERGRSTGGT